MGEKIKADGKDRIRGNIDSMKRIFEIRFFRDIQFSYKLLKTH